MAISETYPLAFLGGRLCIRSVTLDQRRNDELSGTGDGRIWTSQLASPLWAAQLDLHNQRAVKAREINAKIWALDGTRRSFVFADPTYKPASGATQAAGASIASISTDRTTIGIKGLPAGYSVGWGDYFSINWGAGKIFFGAFVEQGTASGGGVVAQMSVTPYLPHGITVDAVIELIRPRLRMIVPPNGYSPFVFDRSGRWGQGASLSLVQKL